MPLTIEEARLHIGNTLFFKRDELIPVSDIPDETYIVLGNEHPIYSGQFFVHDYPYKEYTWKDRAMFSELYFSKRLYFAEKQKVEQEKQKEKKPEIKIKSYL